MTMQEPSDSEKKACPSAARKVCDVTLDQSGWKRYLMPGPLPGRVMERTAMPMMIRNSSGIITLENFSIPFCTPPNTTPAASARKMVWHRDCRHMEAEKVANIVFKAAGSPLVKSKQKDL